MENLIFGAFATLDGYREGDAANLGRTVYDRCTVVALCSAKAQNPACTVALLTNAPVPEPFRSQLTQGGVEIWDCPFTTYRVPADTNWALAYYKLCAMAWVLENRDFTRAAMLDLDTFTQRPLDDLWRECDEAVLLYQVPHAASQTMTAAISRCFDAVEPDGAPHALTHFGGELVAGSRARLTMKPGLSSARIRVLPMRSPTALMSSRTSCSVSRPKMTSHSFILGTGEKKCMPTTREGRLVAAARAVREMEEVLEAKMVLAGHRSSSSVNTACLASRFS